MVGANSVHVFVLRYGLAPAETSVQLPLADPSQSGQRGTTFYKLVHSQVREKESDLIETLNEPFVVCF
jgi:hypothetical protein